MGWARKQYDKRDGKFRKPLKGEKDWSRDEKEAIRQYMDKYEGRTSDDGRQRQAS